MKPMLFFLSLFISGSVFSQKPFQGTVIYELRATGEKEYLEVKVHFGINQLKITSREIDSPRESDHINQYLLIYLDSGKVLTVSDEYQTYEDNSIVEKNAVPLQPTESKIANHTVTPVMSSTRFSGNYAPYLAGESIFYKSSDLYYPIAEKYRYDERLAFVIDNYIVLGADVIPAKGRNYMLNDTAVFKIMARAISVTKTSFAKDFFQVPAGYKREEEMRVADSIEKVYLDSFELESGPDTIQNMVDSTANIDVTVVPAQKDKKKHQPSNQNTPVKSQAIKPKKSKT